MAYNQFIKTFTRYTHRLAMNKDGVFAVELALIAPLLLILLLGALDLTAALHRQIDLQNAVRTGAHYASLHKPSSDSELAKVKTNTENAINANNWYNQISPTTPSVTASLSCGCESISSQSCSLTCPAGERRSVTLDIQATQNHKTLFSYPVLEDTFALTASASIRLQ